MPNAQISVYLTDEEYVKYLKDKETINDQTRNYFKKELKRLK